MYSLYEHVWTVYEVHNYSVWITSLQVFPYVVLLHVQALKRSGMVDVNFFCKISKNSRSLNLDTNFASHELSDWIWISYRPKYERDQNSINHPT